MALWQYTFIILPSNSGYIKPNIGSDDFDDSQYWLKQSTTIDKFSFLDTILPVSKSWHKDIKIWGNLDSNVFEVVCENNIVEGVSFRIDFTQPYYFFLEQILDFLQAHNFQILDEELNILPYDSEFIAKQIENSLNMIKYQILLGKNN